MSKYLIITTSSACYDSYTVFAQNLKRILDEDGHNVTYVQIEKPERLIELLENKYDGIIDFNSVLPGLKIGPSEYLLDRFDCPFYNWILDHPLYHHPNLVVPLKNYKVLCIDRKHAAYVKRFYPNINEVIFKPLPPIKADKDKIMPLKDRPIDLLFTGTYTSREFIAEKERKLPPQVIADINELYEIMLVDSSLAIEDAFEIYLKKHHISADENKLREVIYLYFLADTKYAAKKREDVINTIMDAKLPLTVCGHGWEKYQHPNKKECLSILPERTYRESLDLAYDAKILLNVMPGFKDGLHDRIYTALEHGAIALSDETPYINELFCTDENVRTYKIDDLKKLPKLASDCSCH